MTNAKNLPPGMPKIWSWGGAPEGEGELLCGGGPTEDDLAELFKAVHGYPSLYGPPSQWLADQEDRVSMPFRLFIMLQRLVDWNIKQLPWTQKRKDWLRAAYVFEEREKGKTMEEACAAVAKRLADGEIVKGIKSEPSPAAIGKEMVRKSYQNVMRSLPPEQRPRRTRKTPSKR
jgi:hypothetical protein